MNKKLHVFAVDDHSVILDGYNFMFENLEHNYNTLKFIKAYDGESAYKTITGHQQTPFTIALVDYSIPAYPEQNLQSGMDVATLIRKVMPSCKIVMLTMHMDIPILNNVLKNINPEGFINKSDCTAEELGEAFTIVLNGGIYYSKTVANYANRKEKNITLEDIDVSIIALLAKGIKNKNLSKYIPLTDSIIEARKYKIKKLLNVEGDDKDLINTAKSQGYI